MAIALVVFMLAVAAVPALASQTPSEPPVEEGNVPQIPAPGPAEVAAVELNEREEEEWLESPQAVHEREASQEAFSGISASEARSLVTEAFPEAMASLNEDPGRLLTQLEVEKPLGTYAAVVGNGHGGERSLLETSVPVESELGGEGKQPVDLTLEHSADGFAPANPITELELPAAAEGAIKLHEGVRVDLPTSDDHEAVPWGEENLFIPETEQSTDTLLSPTAGGVEISEQLRSPESPEEFAFELELPKGATLQKADDGGAEVVSADGAVIEEVPPPSALDAQGAPVPVEMKVAGERLVLEIPRREPAEFAYPILLDPEILEEPKNFGAWTESNGGGFGLRDLGSSLNAYSQYNQTYYPETHAQWVYTAPGETAYIAAATFKPIDYLPGSCSSEQPHGYIGLYNVSSGSYEGHLYTYHSPGIALENWEFQTGWVGGPATRDAVIGIGTADQEVNIGCYHELYVGGYSIQEKDLGPPVITSVSGVPGGWFDPQEEERPVTITASDNGFGLNKESISDTEGPAAVTNYDLHNCAGTASSRCPLHAEWLIYPAYQEGEHTLQVTAEDPIGNVTPWTATTRVDFGDPEIEFGGQFAYVTEEEGKEDKASENKASENVLRLPVYDLHVKATDGSTATKGQMLPGVERVAIYLDGVEQEAWPGPECPQSSCPVEGKYVLKLTGLAAGEHKLRIVAEDWLHHKREREIEFEYLPATGESDEYVMQHFSLGEGGEEGPGGPELAVNLMNGNLVYHEQDLDLDTPSTDLEVERQYDSQLPAAQSGDLGKGWALTQSPSLHEEAAEGKSGLSSGPGLSVYGAGGSTKVAAPSEIGVEHFVPALHKTVTKLADGHYELSGEGGEEAGSTVFGASGQPQSTITGENSRVGYRYESGRLSAMVAEDPAATEASVPEAEEAEGGGSPEHPEYEDSIASGGTEAGQISSPGGMALDSSGDLWVTDEETDRVEEFDEEGELLREFGSYGSGDGNLSSPAGLAVDKQGNVWVADRGNRRIEEFSPKGGYLGQFAVAGSTGGLNPASAPSGVAMDAEGDLWVSDIGAGRVDVFTPAGELVRSLGGEDLEEPDAIATGPEGTIWVTDRGLDKVVEFSREGADVGEFGSEGLGEGQFEHPGAIAVDAEGQVWVADTGNGRVEVFDESGEFLHEFGSEGEVAGRFSRPAAIASDGEGHVWVAAVGSEEAETEQPEEPAPEGGSSEGEGPTTPGGEGLVAAYSFDEGEGTVAHDAGGNGHEATIEGAKWTPEGKYGGALEFDAAEHDVVTIADSESLRLEDFTLEAWVRPEEGAPGMPVIGKAGPGQYGYGLIANGGEGEELHPMGFISQDQWVNAHTWDSHSIPTERWTHLAVTNDGESLRLYVNGSLVDERSSEAVRAGEGPVQIGGDELFEDSFFDGRIDEVRVYDRALDEKEINEDRNTAIQTPPSRGPVAAYSFDEGKGTVAHDTSGHGHEATIEGAKWTSEGKFGGALEFDAAEHDELTVPDSEALRLEDFTLEAWVDPAESREEAPVIAKTDPGGFGYALYAGVEGASGHPQGFNTYEEWVYGYVYSGKELPLHQWSHVAVTNDGKHLRLYINGELVDERESKDIEAGEGPLQIGGDEPFARGGFFDGKIDEVRIYNRALSEEELKEDLRDPVNAERTAGLNWQIQKWGVAQGLAAVPVEGGDPEVAFTHEGGDITAIQPSQGPEQRYEYEGDLLAAHSGPEGEASYEYDAHNRLAKVSLPDGATAEISYEAIGRVSALTVQLPGEAAKTTHFEYSDEPRETIVRLPEEPAMVYDIGPEGSVLRWHNVASPPEIESLSGSLWEQRGEIQPEPITPGDQNLLVRAYSPEGIASIKIIADGDQLVEEETCEQDYEKWGTECTHAVSEFVTDTEDWSPGILPLEVIVTDGLGHTESRRFMVDVPYTPPPAAEAPRLPTFQDIKDFREEYDLDPDLEGNKLALDERIFELINAWNDPNTYLGQVARASTEQWGVPLRPVDVAELEYRDRYTEEDGPLIEEWALEHHPTTYAGYQLDDRAGGLLRIGFTENQAQDVAEFIEQIHPEAAGRITPDLSVPARALSDVEEIEGSVLEAIESSPQLLADVAGVEVPESGAYVDVEATDVSAVDAALSGRLGSLAGVHVLQVSGLAEPLLSRERKGGRIMAGDRVWNDWTPTSSPLFSWSSAGFGAEEAIYIPAEKRDVETPFLLGAGHSGNLGTFTYRESNGRGKSGQYLREEGEKIGRVGRDALTQGSGAVDALATRLVSPDLAPLNIFGDGPIGPAGVVRKHEMVCTSGASSEHVMCGRVVGFSQVHLKGYPNHTVGSIVVKSNGAVETGDSGGPVWSKESHVSIGMMSSRREEDHRMWNVQPLLTTDYGNGKQLTGALDASVMGGGSLSLLSNR